MSILGRLAKKKTDIYLFLQKHPFLDALQYVLRNCNNKDICRNIANRNGLTLRCNSYGKENKDKSIYSIAVGKAGTGFFALFRITLKYLAYAERFGLCPVVEWKNSIPYSEENEIFGTKNPFEYYFEQPQRISLDEMRRSYNVFPAEEIHIADFFLDKEIPNGEDGYVMSEEFIDYLATISGKYIRLNAHTKKYIDEQVNYLLNGKRTIGVHVRGSDFKCGYNNHPQMVSVEDYVIATKEVLQEHSYEKIFLATDDLNAIYVFKKEFGDKIVYYSDVIRTEGQVSVAFSESERENHHYLLGLEVLRDMYTLVYCDSLVAGISQVSNCARIVKKSLNYQYENISILNKGINHTSNNFVR